VHRTEFRITSTTDDRKPMYLHIVQTCLTSRILISPINITVRTTCEDLNMMSSANEFLRKAPTCGLGSANYSFSITLDHIKNLQLVHASMSLVT